MGANAQTTVPTFTAGQVLTAAQMNNSARTGVPVFADTSARDAAFGGTGEKTLAEGQLCYLEDSDVVQYYDGSSWATVGPSAESGLTLISTTAIGSAVSSVTVTGAFSATYENYKIIITGGVGSTTLALRMTLAPNAVSYDGGAFGTVYSTSAFAGAGDNAAAQFRYVGGAGSTWQESHIVVLSPFLNKRTFIHATGYWTGSASYAYTGVTTTAGSETDFTISTSAGTITGGTIRVYGYKN